MLVTAKKTSRPENRLSTERKHGLVECLLTEHWLHGKKDNEIESRLLDELKDLDPETYRYVLQEMLYITLQQLKRSLFPFTNQKIDTSDLENIVPAWLTDRIQAWQEQYGPFGHFRRFLPSFPVHPKWRIMIYEEDYDEIDNILFDSVTNVWDFTLWDFTVKENKNDPTEKVFVFTQLQKYSGADIKDMLQVRPEPVSYFAGNDHQIFTVEDHYEVSEYHDNPESLPILKTNLPDPYLAILEGDLGLIRTYWSMGAYGPGYIPKDQGQRPVIIIKDDPRYPTGKEIAEHPRAVSNVITAALYRDDPVILRFLLAHFGKEQLEFRREMLYPLVYAKAENITLFLQCFDDIFEHLTQKDVLRCGRFEILKGYLSHGGVLDGEPQDDIRRCYQFPGNDAADLLFGYRDGMNTDGLPLLKSFTELFWAGGLNYNVVINQTADETRYVSHMESWMFHRTVFENAMTEKLQVMALAQLFRLGLFDQGYAYSADSSRKNELNSQHLKYLQKNKEEDAENTGEDQKPWYRILEMVREKYPCGSDITRLLKDNHGNRGMLLCTFCEAAAAAEEEWFYRVDIYDPVFLRTLRSDCLGLVKGRWIIGCSRFFSVIRPSSLQSRPNRLTDNWIFRTTLFREEQYEKHGLENLNTAIDHGYYGSENAGFQKFPEHIPQELRLKIIDTLSRNRSIEELLGLGPEAGSGSEQRQIQEE